MPQSAKQDKTMSPPIPLKVLDRSRLRLFKDLPSLPHGVAEESPCLSKALPSLPDDIGKGSPYLDKDLPDIPDDSESITFSRGGYKFCNEPLAQASEQDLNADVGTYSETIQEPKERKNISSAKRNRMAQVYNKVLHHNGDEKVVSIPQDSESESESEQDLKQELESESGSEQESEPETGSNSDEACDSSVIENAVLETAIIMTVQRVKAIKVNLPPLHSQLKDSLDKSQEDLPCGKHDTKGSLPKLRKSHPDWGSQLTAKRPTFKSADKVGEDMDSTGDSQFTSDPDLQPDNICASKAGQKFPMTMFGLDGTCDEDYRNKPLPLSPSQQHRTSMQSDIQRNFFDRNLNSYLRNSDDFTLPASQQGTFHKFGDLASLVSATMSGPQELSPREKHWANRLSSSSRSGPLSPSSFATFANKNPYYDSSEPATPTLSAPPPLVYHKQKITSDEWPFRSSRDPSTRVNPTLHDENIDETPTRRQHDFLTSSQCVKSAQHDGEERGRAKTTLATSPGSRSTRSHDLGAKQSRTRSRSPVKKLIGMVKSMSTNQIPNDAQSPKKEGPASSNNRRWKELSNKIRHGFLTADLEQLDQEEMMEQYSNVDDVQILTTPASRHRAIFPVSIKSSGQSKLWSELEYMLIETSNTYLKQELENNRLSRDSIIHAKRQWQARNRPQVIEFYYDQATQYDIIIANLRTVKLYSDYAEDAIMLNSVLHQWKILIRELAVKTLCMPDSVVRRWLHDGRRVLELLGASQITLSHIDRLSGLCFAVFGSAEKNRVKERARAGTTGSQRRNASDGSQTTLFAHEQALKGGSFEIPPMPSKKVVQKGRFTIE